MTTNGQHTTEPQATPKNRGGAPRANVNRATHYLRCQLHELPKGKGLHYITRQCREERRVIEDAVIATGRDIGVYEAATIQTAINWARHGKLCARWLRGQCSDMTPAELLNFSREIARASAERDRCLERLGLDRRDTHDIWSTLDVAPAAEETESETKATTSKHETANADHAMLANGEKMTL